MSADLGTVSFPWDWTERDLYSLLEVERGATTEQIKQAYHLQSLAWHPDKFASKWKDAATSRFQAIADAYKTLGDPKARKRYDATLVPVGEPVVNFGAGPQRNPRAWKSLAAWMKDEGVGTSFLRKMAFQAGDYLERRRQPSEKQARYMLEAWALALEEGWDPKRALADE